MRSADVLLMARGRAGLTQAQLAARSGHLRESIARWEAGGNEPSFETLQQLVRACGLELIPSLAAGDDSFAGNIADQLELPPHRRLEALLGDSADVSLQTLRLLSGLRSPLVVIGSIGAALLGGPQRLRDGRVEVVPGPGFAARLSDELLDAGGWPGDREDRYAGLHALAPWTLPGGGALAVVATPAGSGGYRDLSRPALDVDVGDAGRHRVAHPRDLLRIAEASPWPEDRSRAAGLRALLEAYSDPGARERAA